MKHDRVPNPIISVVATHAKQYDKLPTWNATDGVISPAACAMQIALCPLARGSHPAKEERRVQLAFPESWKREVLAKDLAIQALY